MRISAATDQTDASLVHRILRPFQQFIATEASGGLVLLGCAIVALVWSNSPLAHSYFELWELTLTVGVGAATLSKSLHHWINDGLMVIFFLLVGLEIKRELFAGELSSLKQAALPIAGAVGGMIVPAAIYVALNAGTPGARGWAIPMATDIAFALGVVTLLGNRVPLGMRVFLAALAIVDDIGAVLVIALFYTADLSVASLGAAALILVVLMFGNRAGVRHAMFYGGLGVVLWLCVLASGIHATIAGVLLAATIPARTRIDEDTFVEDASAALRDFSNAGSPTARSVLSNPAQQEALHQLERSIDGVQSPLLRFEHRLHGVVAFVIMPLFALANAGVRLSGDVLSGLSWGVVFGILLGLVAGKVIGICAASFGATATGIAALPAQTTRRSLFAISWLGGIGFTMSLFVATLAFGSGPLLDSAKVGILAASACAGGIGAAMLVFDAKRPRSG